jgi:hypothetical protein
VDPASLSTCTTECEKQAGRHLCNQTSIPIDQDGQGRQGGETGGGESGEDRECGEDKEGGNRGKLCCFERLQTLRHRLEFTHGGKTRTKIRQHKVGEKVPFTVLRFTSYAADLPQSAFIHGYSTKAQDKRFIGRFDDGLKSALTVLARNGVQVTMHDAYTYIHTYIYEHTYTHT